MTKSENMPVVSLRAMEPEDLDTLYRIENDMHLWGIGTTNVPYSRYTLHEYIAESSSDIYTDRQVRLIIEDGSHQTVGIADLVNFDPRHLRAEVGIVIEKPFRSQGYAHAALLRLHDYALRVLHLHQLYAVVDCANHEATALFNSMGYTPTATLHEWLFDGVNYHDASLMQFVLA